MKMNPAPLARTRKKRSIKKCGSEPRPFLALGWVLGRRRSGVNIKRCGVKRRIREEILSKRDKEPEDLRQKKSRRIKERLFSLKEFKKAHTILFYYSKGSEVETKEMMKEALRQEKRVLLPRVKGKEIYLGEIKELDQDVERGSFGILEPKETSKKTTPKGVDLVVIPGIAFDLEGGRIGYGFGYYDRFLKRFPKKVSLVALAYDFQIVDRLPVGRYDGGVGKVITETRIIANLREL